MYFKILLHNLIQVHYSDGNLLFTHTSSAWSTTAGTHGMRTGKWYWEAYQYESLSGNGFPVGISDIDNGTFVATQASDLS